MVITEQRLSLIEKGRLLVHGQAPVLDSHYVDRLHGAVGEARPGLAVCCEAS
jgi:hypothetical protein